MKSDEEKLAELTQLMGGLMKVVSTATLVDTVCELINQNVAAEREACAQIAEGELMEVYSPGEERVAKTIAAAIRARGQEDKT